MPPVSLDMKTPDGKRLPARFRESPWVFPGIRKNGRMVNLNAPWRRIREHADLEGIRLHDLRHTYASRTLCLGEGLPMIGRLLGHRDIDSTARYAHLARESVRTSTARVAENIFSSISCDANLKPVVEVFTAGNNRNREDDHGITGKYGVATEEKHDRVETGAAG